MNWTLLHNSTKWLKSSPFNIQPTISTSFAIPPNGMITWRISLEEIPSFNSTQRQKGKQNLQHPQGRKCPIQDKKQSKVFTLHCLSTSYPLFTTKPITPKKKMSKKFSPKNRKFALGFDSLLLLTPQWQNLKKLECETKGHLIFP